MPKVSINGLEFYYDTAGDGSPLVLISGVSSDHAGWKATQVPDFIAAGFKCLLFDNRDVGQTGLSPTPSYSIRQFAEDTAELIRKIGLGPCHILGASMGGMIAQEMALAYPDLIRSLTLVCTTAKPDPYLRDVIQTWKNASAKFTREEFLQARMPWIFTHRFYSKTDIANAYRQRVLANPFPQPTAAFQRQCDALMNHDTLSRLSMIKARTHVLVGAEDLLMPPRHSQVLAEKIPGAKLTVISLTGHCLFWETPSEFNRAVLDFLS